MRVMSGEINSFILRYAEHQFLVDAPGRGRGYLNRNQTNFTATATPKRAFL